MMKDTRSRAVDVARGIGILCIIVGHFDSFTIRRIVFTFHVPIFFLISGYYVGADRPRGVFFRRKLRTLIVPYGLTCCAIIAGAALLDGIRGGGSAAGQAALDWLRAALYGSGNNYRHHPFPIKGIGAIWFLWATFWGANGLRLLLDVNARLRPLAVLGILLVCCWSRWLCWLPLSIQAGGPALLYMYIGWLLRQARDPLRRMSAETKGFLTLGALILWIGFIVSFQSFSLVRCDTGRGAVDILGSLCGCWIVLLLARIIDARLGLAARALAYLGRYSLLMLCAHIVELDIFPWYALKTLMLDHGSPYWLYQAALVLGKFAWIISATAILERWPLSRRLFGYGPRRDTPPAKSVTVE